MTATLGPQASRLHLPLHLPPLKPACVLLSPQTVKRIPFIFTHPAGISVCFGGGQAALGGQAEFEGQAGRLRSQD